MEETQSLQVKEDTKGNRVPKWGMWVWFDFTRPVLDGNGDVIDFEKELGFQSMLFHNQKEALRFKDQIWLKGFPLNDSLGKDWARVLRVRLVNNELLSQRQEEEESVEGEEVE